MTYSWSRKRQQSLSVDTMCLIFSKVSSAVKNIAKRATLPDTWYLFEDRLACASRLSTSWHIVPFTVSLDTAPMISKNCLKNFASRPYQGPPDHTVGYHRHLSTVDRGRQNYLTGRLFRLVHRDATSEKHSNVIRAACCPASGFVHALVPGRFDLGDSRD